MGVDELPDGLSHLALPILVEQGSEGHLICFATARDSHNRSLIVAAPMVLETGGSPQFLDKWRVLARPGATGHFDESGLSLSDAWLEGGSVKGLTFGWRLRFNGGWFNEVGDVQISGSLDRSTTSLAPTFARSPLDPISMAYPSRGPRGTILYCSPASLDHDSGRPLDFHIHQLDLSCGTRRRLLSPTDLGIPGYFALTRPWVLECTDHAHLWFCARGDRYQLFHALLSAAGDVQEVRMDFTADSSAQESGSAAYPSVLRTKDRTLLAYNGDRYGLTGFGVAELSTARGPGCVL